MLVEPVENIVAAASRGGLLAKVLRWCEGLALYTVAFSLPWEIFQRIPIFNLTVTKSAGSLLIACVFARAIRERAWRLPKTGLEWPLLLFSAAFAQGTTYFEMGRFEDAAASFSLAVQADTRYAGARFRLADCLWAGQDYGNALVEYSRAREMAAEAHSGLFREVRREEETQVEHAIEGAPNDPTALLRVARYRRQEGAWGDAVALYRRVALLEPENAEARVNLNIDVALELDSNIRSIH